MRARRTLYARRVIVVMLAVSCCAAVVSAQSLSFSAAKYTLPNSGLGTAGATKIADLNGDGVPDIVAVTTPNASGLPGAPTSTVSALLGDAMGRFSTATN